MYENYLMHMENEQVKGYSYSGEQLDSIRKRARDH